MKLYLHVMWLITISFLVVDVPIALAWDIPKQIPGDYEGKWYGVHCPLVKPEMMVGERGGDAFPDQKIINAWGYKAKPIEEIKDLLPNQYYEICSNPESWGDIRINETEFIPQEEWPGNHIKLRDEATKKYKGQAYVDEHGHIRNHSAGFPFPGSTNPQEIIWNYMKSRNYGEALYAQFYTAVTDRKGHTRYSIAEQNYMWWKGRLYGDQKPNLEPNPNNYDKFQAMGFWAPYDLIGTIILTYRYDDPLKEDAQWMYIPALRRVRRMAVSQRWDKLPGGQDITYDGAQGFEGKPTNYEFEYLGKKQLLCGHNSTDRLMEIKGKPGGGGCDQTYQRINCVMLQFVPKIVSSVSKGVLFLDPETYNCYYAEYYDKRARPYLCYAHQYVVRKDGCVGIMGFLVSDIQRTHSSNNYVYNSFQNMDAIKEGINPSFFEMAKLRKRYGGR
jgi:hypothetical protein